MSMKWPSVEVEPRLVVFPGSAVSLDEAWEAIEFWEFYSGKVLDAEQRLMVCLMMATDANGLWAAATTATEAPRQNGKGDADEVTELWGALFLGARIGVTAHELPTVASAFWRFHGLIDSHGDLRSRLARSPNVGKGQQEMIFRGDSGGQIMWRTRTKGGMRGLDAVSTLKVDEMQNAKPEQMASSLPTLATDPNFQANFAGTGGIRGLDTNHSEVAWRLRMRALKAIRDGVAPDRFGYLGWTCERVRMLEDGSIVQESPTPEEREWWAEVNFAVRSGRITLGFLEESFQTLGAAKFGREHGCIWDPPPLIDVLQDHPISAEGWVNQVDPESVMVGGLVVGVDVSADLSRAALGVAGRRPDGLVHVELVEEGSGWEWVEIRLARVLGMQPVEAVGVDATGPARVLVPMLERVCKQVGVRLVRLSTADLAAGCAGFAQMVQKRQVWNAGDSVLAVQASTAVKRRLADGESWIWDRRVGEVSSLVAVTVAARLLGGVDAGAGVSVYEDDVDEAELGVPPAPGVYGISSAYEDDDVFVV